MANRLLTLKELAQEVEDYAKKACFVIKDEKRRVRMESIVCAMSLSALSGHCTINTKSFTLQDYEDLEKIIPHLGGDE